MKFSIVTSALVALSIVAPSLGGPTEIADVVVSGGRPWQLIMATDTEAVIDTDRRSPSWAVARAFLSKLWFLCFTASDDWPCQPVG